MLATAGIDVGAANTKVVLLSEDRQVLSRVSVRSGSDFSRTAEDAYGKALEQAALTRSEVQYVVSTGFGRQMVPFRNTQATDLTAHARGALFDFPDTRMVLDIGAQSTRACRVQSNGRVIAFRINAKCAAGAGMFLTRAARYLELNIEDMGRIALQSTQPVEISSVCAVLAETEIINQITAGAKVEDIVRGLTVALVDQALIVAKRTGIQHPLTLTGGMSRNQGLVAVLEEQLRQKINVTANGSDGGYYAGAIGAALLGFVRLRKMTAAG